RHAPARRLDGPLVLRCSVSHPVAGLERAARGSLHSAAGPNIRDSTEEVFMSTRMAVYTSAATLALAAGTCMAQTDSFHIMQIQMAIGGVNGDTTAQAVQLRMRTSFQQFVQQ